VCSSVCFGSWLCEYSYVYRSGAAAIFIDRFGGGFHGGRNGRILGPEWLKQVGRLKNDPAYPFELPPDLELSVDDVKQHWAID
jgi:hypothetical protein